MIFRESRYEDVDITTVVNKLRFPDGRPYLHPRKIIDADKKKLLVSIHEKISGEELDLITHDNGAETPLWHVMADINGVQNPFTVPKGKLLEVPNTFKVKP